MGTMMLALLATASEVASEAANEASKAAAGGLGPLLVAVIVALLGSSVVANIVTAVMTSLRASAETRRQRYAAAVEALTARIEYPYRIRRRTDDDAETLAKLAGAGHDLQQRLSQSRAWVAAENAVMGKVFAACVTALDEPFKAASRQAWEAAPITTAAQMNLNGFGMGDQQEFVERMQCALVYRFGWRRFIPNWRLQELLKANGCLPMPVDAGDAPGQTDEAPQPGGRHGT